MDFRSLEDSEPATDARRYVKRTTPLTVEPLEVRDCPATVSFVNGVLTVTGTSGNDTITVSQGAGTIVAEGRAFKAAAVKTVVVSGGAGNDTIIDNSGRGAFLYGGTGNDTIYGNGGDDKIYGGAGNDTLYGGDGNDVVWGGGGQDAVNGGAGSNTVGEGSPTATRGNSAVEAEIIRLVNAERAKAGLSALRVSGLLNQAASLHTADMVAVGNALGAANGMQHTLYGSARPMVTDRLDAAGYDTWTSSYSYGENIAYGYANAAAAMAAWMNSGGHRANILNPNFVEIGVSVQAGAGGRLYFTQVFGRQS